MTAPKTEAERRFEMFLQRGGFSPIEANHAKAIIHAIFDPLPTEDDDEPVKSEPESDPESDPAKSLGQIAYEARNPVNAWDSLSVWERNTWHASADAVVVAHEALRLKSTTEAETPEPIAVRSIGGSKGATALRKKTKKRGAKAALSARLCIPQGMVCHWISGHRTPSLAYAIQIEKHLGIPCEWWHP